MQINEKTIAIVNFHFPFTNMGGIESFLSEYLRKTYLKEKILLIYSDNSNQKRKYYEYEGIKCLGVKYKKILKFFRKHRFCFLLSLFWIRKKLKKIGVKVILANDFYSALPFIFSKHFKVVFINHGVTNEMKPVYSTGASKVRRFIDSLILSLIIKFVEKIVFVSNYEKNFFEKIQPHFSFKSIFISTMVDTNKIKKYKTKKVENYFVYAGRLVELKQIEQIIEAFAQSELDDHFLYIIGSGKEEKNLKNFSCRMGISSKVIFKGELPREELFKILSKAKSLILASKSEGKPMIALESIALDVPLIMPDIGSLRELANYNKNSILFTKNSVRELSLAIKAKSKQEFRTNNKSNFDFNSKKVSNKLDDLLDSLH